MVSLSITFEAMDEFVECGGKGFVLLFFTNPWLWIGLLPGVWRSLFEIVLSIPHEPRVAFKLRKPYGNLAHHVLGKKSLAR